MNQTYAKLEEEARSLPAAERSQLVDSLLESLHEGKSAEIEKAWAIEIERRVLSYERGEAKMIPAEEVFANVCADNPAQSDRLQHCALPAAAGRERRATCQRTRANN